MAKVTRYICKCVYCLYPFGPGAPVCIRERMVTKNYDAPLRQCTEKGCKHYSETYRPQKED